MNIEHNDKWQSLGRVYNINYLLTESEVFTVKILNRGLAVLTER